ncbi:flagellar motor switch protein FliM [Clostridium aminobutyricum]|uniref:Flagellar motor switch protein FliM n=1 Tax=Clostridium aminobutyricum TaxID=33953 RepID=A0A939D9N4_CLOAM|nr:flagellar motor switch protein FliM [Clostridium aminobutyricum]MBN7773762.1 flagellar motor switch protein FliM [Clostridium aminobutyricum]
MADVLSQSQIDALLNSLSSSAPAEIQKHDEEETRKIKKYDFKTPKKFTRDRLKLVFSVYENFARVLSSYLTSMMRLSCQVEMVDIEEQKYFEFNNALSENDIVAMVEGTVMSSDDSEPENIMIQMSNPIIYALIDRMIGGSGENEGVDYNAGFTDIEISLFENIMVHILPIMEESWRSYFDIKFSYDKIETNPRLIQSIQADEIVVIIVLNIEIKETTGTFNICIPGNIMEGVFKQAEQAAKSTKRRDHQNGNVTKEEILESIKDSPLEMRAFLGEASILLEDIYALKPGDVINLKKPKDSDVSIYIEDKPWYKGRMGERKGNVAVKITGTTLTR